MNKWLVCLLAGWIPGVCGVLASEAEFFPSGDAAWTVEIERSASPVGQKERTAPYAVKYDIQRKGNVRLDRITFSNGQVVERWWTLGAAPFVLEKAWNGNEYFYSPNENTRATAFDGSMFRWLQGKEPLGEEKWKGKACLIFAGEVQEEHGTTTRKAWIDKETGRVCGMQAAALTYVFTFHEKTPERLDAPATLRKRADRARRLIGN